MFSLQMFFKKLSILTIELDEATQSISRKCSKSMLFTTLSILTIDLGEAPEAMSLHEIIKFDAVFFIDAV